MRRVRCAVPPCARAVCAAAPCPDAPCPAWPCPTVALLCHGRAPPGPYPAAPASLVPPRTELFADISEALSQLGLALGGSEDWADRLYIEDKKGGVLFTEEELDVAEEAQKRMELMYNVDAWSTQLVVRVGSGQLLLTSGIDGTREDVLSRVLKRLEEDTRYHSEVTDARPGRTPNANPTPTFRSPATPSAALARSNHAPARVRMR